MARNKSRHVFELDTDKKKLEKGLQDVEKQVNKTSGVFAAFRAKAVAAIAAVTFGLYALVEALQIAYEQFKKSIAVASDLQETTSKFETVFKDVKLQAEIANQAIQKEFGLSELQARKLLSATGDILTGFGLSADEALNLSVQLNRLAIDLASFTNATGGAEAVSKALTSALLGEREALKTYGIVIRDADIQARLAQKGLKDLTGEAKNQAVAFETLAIATEQAKNAIGDYARTSDSFANANRRLQASLENIYAGLGRVLIPTLSEAADVTDRWLGSIEGYLQLTPADKMREEKEALDALVFSIINSKDNQKLRNDLIDDLQREYPDFLSNLDDEKVTNQELRDRLREVNEQYQIRINLLATSADLTENESKAVEAVRERNRIRRELERSLNNTIESLGLQVDKELELERKVVQVNLAIARQSKEQQISGDLLSERVELADSFKASTERIAELEGTIKNLEDERKNILQQNNEAKYQAAILGDDELDRLAKQLESEERARELEQEAIDLAKKKAAQAGKEDERALEAFGDKLEAEEREEELTERILDNAKERNQEVVRYLKMLDASRKMNQELVDIFREQIDLNFKIDAPQDLDDVIRALNIEFRRNLLALELGDDFFNSEEFTKQILMDIANSVGLGFDEVEAQYKAGGRTIVEAVEATRGLLEDKFLMTNVLDLFLGKMQPTEIEDYKKSIISVLRAKLDAGEITREIFNQKVALTEALFGKAEDLGKQMEQFTQEAKQQAEFLLQSLGASIGGGLADAIAGEEDAMKDALKGILITLVNFMEQKLVIAEVDQLIDTLLSSISLNPAALLAAFAGLEAVKAGIRNFATGTENFSGGVAKVHRDETLMLPPGTDVVNARKSQQLERAAMNPNAETNALLKQLINVTANRQIVIKGAELREVLKRDERNRL